MDSEKQNSMNKAGHSNTSTQNNKSNPQQNRNQFGYKSEAPKQGSGASQPKFEKQSQSEDKSKKETDSKHRSK